MEDPRIITARSLLLTFLELRRFSRDMNEWTEEQFSSNPPRLFRLRQLVAMFRAFRLAWDPLSFSKGKFVEYDHPKYDALIKKSEEEHIARRQLPDYFKILFDYRTRVDDVLHFSHGVMETSGLYELAYHKTDELNQVIRENIQKLENILAELISPEGASFTIEQMEQEYDYPDVDLFEIDSEWW